MNEVLNHAFVILLLPLYSENFCRRIKCCCSYVSDWFSNAFYMKIAILFQYENVQYYLYTFDMNDKSKKIDKFTLVKFLKWYAKWNSSFDVEVWW